jgi:xylulokinase
MPAGEHTVTAPLSRDIVVGIDSSTQSTKAIAWSRDGVALAEGRALVAMAKPAPGWCEQDPDDWWSAACTALRAVTRQIDPARIAGLAISNQRETVAFVDRDFRPVRSAILWLDERGASEISRVCSTLGADRIHRITGKPADATPVIYTLSWLRHHDPGALDRADLILDAHGFLTARLTGHPTASWTSADPFGMFDIEAKEWSAPLLDHLGLGTSDFAPVARPGTGIGEVSAAAAAATGLTAGTPVFAAGGDGQCAGLGVNAVRPGTVYLNLGTAVLVGIWSDGPRIARTWRTLTSPTGEGYFLEGCQRAGAYFTDWLAGLLSGGQPGPETFARLESLASALPIGSEGLTVCPYLSGVMDPHWDPSARAAFLGLSSHHGAGHLYRAGLEAITLESARCVAAMAADGLDPRRLIAVGGGANSTLWGQMVADATGLPLTISQSLEASALGAGITAAVGARLYGGFAEAATGMSREGSTLKPNPSTAADWAALSRRQADAYRGSALDN